MKEAFEKSLQMIKILNIKSEEEYNKLLHHYLLLSAESLKYIAQERDFYKIIGLAWGLVFYCKFDNTFDNVFKIKYIKNTKYWNNKIK